MPHAKASCVGSHKYTQEHNWKHMYMRAQAKILNHKGSKHLDTDILHLCYNLQLSKLRNANTDLCQTIWQPTGPTSWGWKRWPWWWAEVRLSGARRVDKWPTPRHPPSARSSAPQDVTPSIILLHATQLRSVAFFGYNQAFILILWWLSQALEQRVAPELAPQWQGIRGGWYYVLAASANLYWKIISTERWRGVVMWHNLWV